MRRKSYRVVESKKIYSGHCITLYKDRFILDRAKDKLVTRELVAHPGAVAVVPFLDKNTLILIRQFRYSAEGDLWEIPAGTLEKNETPLSCAKRELEEETGFRALRWHFLTRFYLAPGISNELMTLYRAEDLKPGTLNLDHDEWIHTREVSLQKALEMVRRGLFRDAKTILGILWAARVRK